MKAAGLPKTIVPGNDFFDCRPPPPKKKDEILCELKSLFIILYSHFAGVSRSNV